MGGCSAGVAASMKDQVESLHIGAAVLMHPACPDDFFATPIVPSMFLGSEFDKQVPPRITKGHYHATPGVPKAYIEGKGVAHCDPATYQKHRTLWGTPPRILNHYVLDWLNCFLKKNITACALAKCGEPQASSPTSACFFDDVNPNYAVAVDRAIEYNEIEQTNEGAAWFLSTFTVLVLLGLAASAWFASWRSWRSTSDAAASLALMHDSHTIKRDSVADASKLEEGAE